MDDKILIKIALVTLMCDLLENDSNVQQHMREVFTENTWDEFTKRVLPPYETGLSEDTIKQSPVVVFDSIASLLTRLSEGENIVPRTN